MYVSREQATVVDPHGRGPRARTMRLMLETASGLMQEGQTPSVSDVAEAAGVSRATAYRYFPSQAALVDAVVDTALGPILDWSPDMSGAGARVDDLLETSMPRIGEFEATFRAALKLSLEQWGKRKSGTLGTEAPFSRGHRVGLLRRALAPLRDIGDDAGAERLAMGLSLVFGVESLVVLKDIWGIDQQEAETIVHWVAETLVASVQARHDAGQPSVSGHPSVSGSTSQRDETER